MPLILIVDDNLQTLNLFTAILRRQRYEIATAAAGEDALGYLQNGSPDVVLLDLNLPGLDGIDVLRFIRRSSHLSRVKVLAITGFPELTPAAYANGADKIMFKPLNATELVHAIEELLSG